jgi:hypothetical protein
MNEQNEYEEIHQQYKEELQYLTPMVNDLLSGDFASKDVFMSNVDLTIEKFFNLPLIYDADFKEHLMRNDILMYLDLASIAAATAAWASMSDNVLCKLNQ